MFCFCIGSLIRGFLSRINVGRALGFWATLA